MILGSSPTEQLTSGLKVITGRRHQRKALCENVFDSVDNGVVWSFPCSGVCYGKVNPLRRGKLLPKWGCHFQCYLLWKGTKLTDLKPKRKKRPKCVPLVFTPLMITECLSDAPEQVRSVGGDKLGTCEMRNLEPRRVFGGQRQ